MQCVDVADCVSFEVAGAEALSSPPVVKSDAQFVLARRQGADVDFAAQRDNGAGADASVALGDALAKLVDDMYGEGVA